MRHALLSSAAILALVLAPAPAPAKDLPSGGLTVEEVASWLQSAGYPAKIQTEKDGSQTIQSAADGADFHIDMYDCHHTPRCSSLEFFAGFNTKGAFNAAKMNDWNRNNRWVRAYVDSTNDPWIEMDVDLYPGGTYEGLKDQFGIWRDEFASFRKYIHW
jgi:hypothetical protein